MGIVSVICLTFIVVLVSYMIVPIKKMRAVNKELIQLLQVLPLSKLLKVLTRHISEKKEVKNQSEKPT